MSVLRILLSVLLCYSVQSALSPRVNSGPGDVCSSWSKDWRDSSELKRQIYTAVKPSAGSNAGKYSEIHASDWYECVARCCEFNRCNVAYWFSSTCFHIECVSDELCRPVDLNDQHADDTLYMTIRSVQMTAADGGYDDPGHDECNQTKPCAINERCEQVSINAELQRNICLCDRNNGFRRINGVCREYSSRGPPCALYEKDYEDFDELLQGISSGHCKKDEECLPPTDRAKHGYCQCKLGYRRSSATGKCEELESPSFTTETTYMPMTTKSPTAKTTASSATSIQVYAGDNQKITLPNNQVDLKGKAILKSDKSEITRAMLDAQHWRFVWSMKSSSNGGSADVISQNDAPAHSIAKNLQQGVYDFELKLVNDEGKTLASDVVQVEVNGAQTTLAPLLIIATSPVRVRLPQQTVLLTTKIEPSNRQATYQWTYLEDGPVTPIFETSTNADLLVSNLRPGNYSFRVRAIDNLGNQQTKTILLVAVGDPIEARVTNAREIVFWPSSDVVLDGTPSITEIRTKILWTLLSTDNREENQIDIASPTSLKTRITNLRIGQYKFRLALTTNDHQYTSTVDVIVIVYAQNGRPPKVQLTLETLNVNILNNLIILNGSQTTADYGIAKWQWMKSSSSPALGSFVNNSDVSPIAYVTNLIEGQYVFTLQVVDDRQQTSEASVTVNVDGVPEAENLIELRFASRPALRQQTLDNLLAQIRAFLIDVFPQIRIDMVGLTRDNILLIKAKDSKTNLLVSPKIITSNLRKKLKPLRSASNVDIVSIDTFLCLSNCSNHGQCDNVTKRCVCHRYYMPNWFKMFVYQEQNCDFLIHYFVLIAVTGSIASLVFCCCCLCCCLRWRRRRYLLARRKRIRYQLLHEQDDDDDANESVLSSGSYSQKKKGKSSSSKKHKGKTSNVIISESDYDLSDENGEQTLYDKPLLTSKLQMQSPSTPKSRGFKVPVQDSNGSPMVRNNGQSTPTTDNSVV